MITPAYYAFLDELKQNMNRPWFKANRERFERDVFRPFELLVGYVMESLRRDMDLPPMIQPRDLMFRFYRDTRFSADKSPYKLWMGAVVSKGGRKNDRYPELYFQLGADENFIGTGLYRPSKEMLFRIREAIHRNPARIRAIHEDPLLRRFFPEGLLGERNKRLPFKEWMETAAKEPLILNKRFYTYRTYPRETFLGDPSEFIAAHFHAMEAWNKFLLEISKNI
ncbi:MAG: DUF2461 domain-containing protein [Chlorobi bacterium]|nr:DUF2461 domain-containing protein [Chlorobiota bacterium]